MILKIDGVDISDCIESGGFEWTIYDIEDPKAGRTLDGVMHRGRVCQKVKLKIKCRIMKTAEIKRVLNAINPEFVQVQYLDPMQGGLKTGTFYSNNKPATCVVQTSNGTELWSGFSFPLVER